MAAAKYIKLIAEAKKLIPRFYREYKGASDWWYPVTIDGKVFELNFTTHDPEGTGSFPKKKQDKVKIVAYPNGIDGKFFGLGYFQGVKQKMRQIEENPKRCWKGYAPVRGMKPYSKGSCRKVQGNPARQPDEAIARELYLFIENDEILLTRRYPQYILNLERKMKRGVYDREKAVKLFMYLADEASKRYSKQFGDGKTHTADVPTRMLVAKMLRDRFESERRAMGIGVEIEDPAKYYADSEQADLQEPMGIIRGKRVIRKNSSCGVNMNPVSRTKTWKLGEYGGNIKANVNQSGTAVQIIHSDKPLIAGAYGRLFRWPLDRNELEMHLTDLTTSYYASKIIEWVDSVTKGTSMNPAPAGYHTMPDGRVMADSAHSVSMNPKDQGDYNSPEVSIVYKAKYSDLGWQGSGGSVEKFANSLGGRGTGGGTDMRTGLRDKSFKFKTIAGAVKFASKMKPYALRISAERYNHDTMKREKLPVGKSR
jgi:hypothetical protein